MSTTQMPVGPLVGPMSLLTTPWRNYLSPLTAISWDTTSLTIDLSGVTAGDTSIKFKVNSVSSPLTPVTISTTDVETDYCIAKFDGGGNAWSSLEITNSNSGVAGPGIVTYHNSASPAVSDTIGYWDIGANNSAAAFKVYASCYVLISSPTAAAETAQVRWKTYAAGVLADRMILGGGGGGLQLGGPTGGDKGAGTINVSSGVFLNGTAYTNPDYALEHYFTGEIVKFADNPGASKYLGLMPLDNVEGYMAETFRLPGIHRESMDIFERADVALEKIEQAWLYIVQLHNRLSYAEAKLEELSC